MNSCTMVLTTAHLNNGVLELLLRNIRNKVPYANRAQGLKALAGNGRGALNRFSICLEEGL
jgi:hypothetical protein